MSVTEAEFETIKIASSEGPIKITLDPSAFQVTKMAVTDFVTMIPFTGWVAFLLFAFTIHFARLYFKPSLYKLPGSFLASLTNWWRLCDVSRGQHHQTLIHLHRDYGSDFVRIGPNTVSVADPEAKIENKDCVKCLVWLSDGDAIAIAIDRHFCGMDD